MKKVHTLCIIHKGNKILLGMKKRGFGVGRWNGFGGKPKVGEKIEETAKREISEEAKIKVASVEELGIINFEYDINPDVLEVHIFKVTDFTGLPEETEEMKPEWFDIDKIPFKNMWPDDQYWMPLFLKNKKFKGKFIFEGFDKIIDYKLEDL